MESWAARGLGRQNILDEKNLKGKKNISSIDGLFCTPYQMSTSIKKIFMRYNIWEKSKKVGAILFHAPKSHLRMKDFPCTRERLFGMWDAGMWHPI